MVSNEPDDASVVAKVSSGEADAGIVYTSDITTADVGSVAVPADINVTATYPIAVVTGATQSDLATSFVTYVTGAPGRRRSRPSDSPRPDSDAPPTLPLPILVVALSAAPSWCCRWWRSSEGTVGALRRRPRR